MEETMRTKLSICVALLLFVAPMTFSQTNEITRQNRTVEVTVTESISVPAEVAEVTIGCLTHGQTHDQAYQENLRIADRVVKALLASGVQKEDIVSDTVELREDNLSNRSPSASSKESQRFSAEQTWKVRVAAGVAQKIVDAAVHAGANGIESVSWEVNDPEALEAKARTAALEKARATAAEIAKGLGGNLGEPLYASNVLSGMMSLFARSGEINTQNSSIGGSSEPTFDLKLFPEKVQKSAVVRVVFALN
jgi:uncharacterized protein YggE